MQAEAASVDPHEQLFVTARKRFVPVYNQSAEGVRELTLYCGLREITFDEPDLFPWAERLIQEDSFMAGAAVSWASPPLEWPRVQGLLEALLAEGVLDREPPGKTIGQLPSSAMHLAFLESERTRPVVPEPRFWNPDPSSVLKEVVGRGVEPGYIEAVVPVHRIAHAALDQEGRQVGEVNTFPEILRLKIPTEWKTCNYAGSRYHDETPMNMTALRSMIAHWRPVLRTTLACREEFLRRYPPIGDGTWRLGEVHFLSSGILALVGFELMRWNDPVKNGELDPVLSSLFRVTDGVRMVAAHMMDVPKLRTTYDTQIVARDITDMAEREQQFHTSKGVCAGPQNMIEEFVTTLLDGKPLEGPAEPLPQWAEDIPKALDYGLLGIQTYATVFCTWMRMTRAYTEIRDNLISRGGPDGLREAIERDFKIILPVHGHEEEQRSWSEAFARRMFNHAQEGIRGVFDRQDLAVLLTPPQGLLGERAPGALRDLFASLGAEGVADPLLDFLRFERNALKTVTQIQERINALLGRPPPSTPLTGAQLAIHHLLRKGTRGAVPSLVDLLRDTLDVDIQNHAGATTVSHGGRSLVLH
jgi:hypothetical protein